jgi:hypothetical protein
MRIGGPKSRQQDFRVIISRKLDAQISHPRKSLFPRIHNRWIKQKKPLGMDMSRDRESTHPTKDLDMQVPGTHEENGQAHIQGLSTQSTRTHNQTIKRRNSRGQ